MSNFWKRFALVFCVGAILLAPMRVAAQAVTGVLSGSVVDTSGAVVPGATITLVNESTGDKRELKVETDGGFVIAGVFPGRYTLLVEASGFKRLERQNINITAAERAAVGALVLDVGAISESVKVTAQGDLVQTSSQERSSVLTGAQVGALTSQGRTVVGLLRVVPGIPNPGDGGGLPNVNGLPTGFATMTTDGTPNTELGTAFTSTRPSLDAVGEVKVLTSNYQAEYGVTGGAIIQVVTKSGSTQFHGSGFWYDQHEMFNANSFFNNRNSVQKAVSRAAVVGVSAGGPIYIPHRFNANKDKVFFFWDQEDRHQPSGTNGLNLVTNTVPTDLERAGNFSQTLDVSGKLVPIKDPLGGANFPGNIIPAARINPNAPKLLSIFPQPNFVNRAISGGNYNFVIQHPGKNYRLQSNYRFDYNVSSKVRLYLRGIHELNQEFDWLYQFTQPQLNGLNHIPKTDVGINSTQILSPTIVNEFLIGTHHRTEYRSVAPANDPLAIDSATPLAGYSRSKLGVNLPTLYNNNPFNVIPAMSFSDVPSAMNLTWSQGGYFPPTTSELALTASDALSKTWRKHTIKAGIQYTHLLRMSTGGGSPAGNFAFGRDTKNVNDANYGYANALLGNFTTYQESTSVPLTRDKSTIVEWFLQDNWKASSRLILDYGIRFGWVTPFTEGAGNASNFITSRWSPKNAPVLYQPTIVGGQRIALNPLNGQTAAVTLIGALVPNSGDPANGMVLASDSAFPPGFLTNRGVQYGPRFGLAYDVFGNGKTALRIGAGVYHNFQPTNVETVFVQNPPVQFTPTIYYGNLTNYFNTQGVLFPSNANGFELSGKSPTVYSYSFGIQRDVGFGTILDVAFVGNQSRHNTQRRNVNALAPGARFLPSAQDPTKPGSPLPDDFLRPYPGYGNITVGDRTGNSNYNSLQVQANRRFARNVQFGASWTWSKAMAYAATPAQFAPARLLSYSEANFDFTHILVLNWLYDLPKGSRLWNNFATRTVLDDWHLAGIATFQSGAPLNITFTTVDGADLAGGGDTQRVNVISNPYIPKGDRTFFTQFSPTAFGRPAKGTLGTLGSGLLRGPGTNNFDLTLNKDFQIKERIRIRLQFEAYNAFNHTQFSAVNTTARFDAAGAQVNGQLGNFTAARTPRNGQASLRITF